ncbi:FMRFamide receptor-like [Physella acuta]|uniref:FMRFamide receptor-like n=1 Tax=Physella acuta TaxID=109671 RepID=UPI0027DAE542|nr:FMRFamide receptor-like [Physella acuta]XP_059166192.1 FMRFamide receptor-like [Physella acuta]
MSDGNASTVLYYTDMALGVYIYDISPNVFDQLSTFINCFLIHIMCLFGILGNVITIVILVYNGFTVATNIALIALAVSDLFYSVTQSLGRVQSIVYKFNPDLAYCFYSYYMVYIFAWNQCTITTSAYIVTAIAIERMIAVWFPFKVVHLITPIKMGCIVILLGVLTVVIYSPYAIYVQLDQRTLFVNKTVTWYKQNQPYINNVNFFEVYRTFVTIFSNVIIPLIIILVCCFVIILRLTLSNKTIKKMTLSEKRVRDLKSVKITLLVCLSLVVLVLIPLNALDIYLSYSQTNLISPRIQSVLMYLLQCVSQCSASTNFIIYVLFNPKFFSTYKKLFLLRCYMQ